MHPPGVIFLDIDGVLVPFQEPRPHPQLKWSLQAMEALNEICRQSGLSVVICSTWRLREYANTGGKMLRILRSNGFTGELYSQWCTPGESVDLNGRSDEIHRWIRKNGVSVTDSLVIDDCDVGKSPLDAQLSPRTIMPDPYIGLTAEHARLANDLLSVST